MNFPIVLIHFSTVDKLAGPNVSFTKRFHCIRTIMIYSTSLLVHTYVCTYFTVLVYTYVPYVHMYLYIHDIAVNWIYSIPVLRSCQLPY